MFILAINTSLRKSSIAFIEDGRILDEETWISEKSEAENLMPKIDKYFMKHDKKYIDLVRILVISGPGSFTGLRVGVTVANTLKYLTSADLISVNTFEYFWWSKENNDKNEEKEKTALLIFAGIRGVYLSATNEDTQEKDVELLDINEVNDRLEKLKVTKIFGELVDEQLKKINVKDKFEIKTSFGENILYILKNKDFKSEKIVVPIYVKKPDISVSKKSLFN